VKARGLLKARVKLIAMKVYLFHIVKSLLKKAVRVLLTKELNVDGMTRGLARLYWQWDRKKGTLEKWDKNQKNHLGE
jgi:hypothetical protein